MPRSRKSLYSDSYRTLLTMLVEARETAGITQVQLAQRVKTSQSMLSRLERGIVRMDLSDLFDYLIDGIRTDPIDFLERYLKRTRRAKAALSRREQR